MGDFVSLTKTLTAKDFGRPFAKLSRKKQALVASRFKLIHWDALPVERKPERAALSDFERDPSNEDLREKLWELQLAITGDIEKANRPLPQQDVREMSAWAARFLASPGASREGLLKQLKKQDRELNRAPLAGLPSVVDRITKLRQPPEAPGAGSPPVVKRNSPLQRLVAVLESMSKAGVDIASGHRGDLHKQALQEANIKNGGYGSSRRTFERAVQKALQNGE